MITMMNRLNAIASVAKSLWMNRRVVTRVVILSMMFSLANIYPCMNAAKVAIPTAAVRTDQTISNAVGMATRSEEHTSELQSRFDLVCRLLLEKKKNITCKRRTNRALLNIHL